MRSILDDYPSSVKISQNLCCAVSRSGVKLSSSISRYCFNAKSCRISDSREKLPTLSTSYCSHFHIAKRPKSTKDILEMADGEINGTAGLDLVDLRRSLLSNSTKRRSTEVNSLQERIASGGECQHKSTLQTVD